MEFPCFQVYFSAPRRKCGPLEHFHNVYDAEDLGKTVIFRYISGKRTARAVFNYLHYWVDDLVP